MSSPYPAEVDPATIPFLQTEIELFDYCPDNGRETEINQLYQNQIFHASSRYKGSKVSDGYEELVSSQHPIQVIYPDKFHSTGLAYSANSKAMYETMNPTKKEPKRFCFCCLQQPLSRYDYEPMLIYSQHTPDLEKMSRYKLMTAVVWILMVVCVVLAILTFIISPFTYKNAHIPFLHRPTDSYDTCNLVVLTISMLILFLGIIVKNPSIILTFLAVYTVDCFINLLRLYSVLQFGYFLAQLALIYAASYYRVLISPTFYFSQ